MNLETINKWLDEEYGCSFTKLEELQNFYFEKYCDLQQENRQLQNNINKLQKELNEENFQCSRYAIKINDLKENKQLKDNWKKLKEYIKEEGFEINTREYGSLEVIDKYAIIEKMRELEIGIGKDD